MQVKPADNVNFGYRHQLKTLWLKGKLPSVKFGVYGDNLTKDTVSLEHFKPVSQGGKTILGNLGLASKEKNNLRGSKPLREFLTLAGLKQYLEQFTGVNVDDFNGNKYSQLVIKNVGEQLK